MSQYTHVQNLLDLEQGFVHKAKEARARHIGMINLLCIEGFKLSILILTVNLC